MNTTHPLPWWSNAVVYQLYVRSFADANGDGIGDLDGITNRLQYLADLGIDAIWLNPCYPSPQKDHGYDVADYLNIEPEYGDLAAYDRLIAEATRLNIRVLMDIVPNHCSTENDWFKRALAAGAGSELREWFYFRDGKGDDGSLPPNNWQAWFGGSAWNRTTNPDGTPGQWYLAMFTPDQPDLNWNHEPVRLAFDNILRFWWDRGAAGFRIDAPAVVGKTPGLPDAPPVPEGTLVTDIAVQNPHVYHRPEVHELFVRWRSVADAYEAEHPGRDIVLIGETFGPSLDIIASYVNERELHTTFFFTLLLNNWEAHRWRQAIQDGGNTLAKGGTSLAWTLNNHDAQRNVSRLGHSDAHLPSSFTFNNLINSHEPVDVEVGTRRARASMLIQGALPGPLFLYFGEELGLPEVLDLPEWALQDPIWERSGRTERGRDGCRVPMPWTSDASTNYGFSDGTDAPQQPWLPQPAQWSELAADQQTNDPNSMLSLYRDVLAARRAMSTQPWVDMLDLPQSPDDTDQATDNQANEDNPIVAYKRGNTTVIANLGSEPFVLPTDCGEIILASGHCPEPGILPSDTAVWLGPARQ